MNSYTSKTLQIIEGAVAYFTAFEPTDGFKSDDPQIEFEIGLVNEDGKDIDRIRGFMGLKEAHNAKYFLAMAISSAEASQAVPAVQVV